MHHYSWEILKENNLNLTVKQRHETNCFGIVLRGGLWWAGPASDPQLISNEGKIQLIGYWLQGR